MAPPDYTKIEWGVLGTPATADTANAKPDEDKGRGLVYEVPLLNHAFKTPSLRNVALTAPYMHNGVYKSLEQVIDFYNRGGGAGVGNPLPNQTLPSDKLNLTKQEQQNIITFLHALTDTTGLPGKPATLPALGPQSSLGNRKVGGEY
jgi:cytochrome c peroxidase